METDTATPVATEAAPTPIEAQEAATDPSPEGAAVLPRNDAETAEEPTSPPPAWATVTDLYDLEEIPEVKEHLSRRDRQVQEKLRGEAEEQVKAATRNWEATQVHNSLAGYAGSILQKIETADVDGAERLLDRLENLAGPYKEDYEKKIKGDAEADGANKMNGALYQSILNSLSRKETDEFEDYVKSKSPDWPSALKQYVEMKVRPLKAELQSKDDTINRMKAEGRTDKGPNLVQSAPGGGRPTPQQYAAATPEQRKKWREEGIEAA